MRVKKLSTIKVKFFARVREIVSTPRTEISVNDKIKLIDFMNLLANKYGSEFRDYVFKADQIAGHIMLMINGNAANDHDVFLEENDTLAILPPVGGGNNLILI
jgi:MoaD family protein